MYDVEKYLQTFEGDLSFDYHLSVNFEVRFTPCTWATSFLGDLSQPRLPQVVIDIQHTFQQCQFLVYDFLCKWFIRWHHTRFPEENQESEPKEMMRYLTIKTTLHPDDPANDLMDRYKSKMFAGITFETTPPPECKIEIYTPIIKSHTEMETKCFKLFGTWVTLVLPPVCVSQYNSFSG